MPGPRGEVLGGLGLGRRKRIWGLDVSGRELVSALSSSH